MSEFRIVVMRDRVTVVHGAHIPEVQVRLLVPQWRTTMGLFDTVELYDDVHLPKYPEGITPAEDVDWQTKGIDRPNMTTFRVTADGRLLEEEWHTEAVPPEDRPYASRDDVEEGELLYMAGCRNPCVSAAPQRLISSLQRSRSLRWRETPVFPNWRPGVRFPSGALGGWL